MSEYLSVTEPEIRDYLAKPSSSGLVKSLLREKKSRGVGEVLGYADAVKTYLPGSGHASGFLSYVERFKSLKAKTAFRVWTTPAAYHWNAMARMLLDASIGRTAPAGILKQYLEFLDLDLAEGLNTHLNDFGRFVLSGLILERAEVRLDLPISIKLPNVLPGTGLALLSSQGEARTISVSVLDQSTIDRLAVHQNGAGGELGVAFGSGNGCTAIAWSMLRWKGPNRDILIDAFEPCLTLPYVEAYPRCQSPAQSRDFLSVMENALDRLAKYDPELVEEISLLTSSVTPMDASAADAEMCSGTSSAIFGACFLSLTDEPLYLAEMLLHEFCHNKLRLFEEVSPLLLSESLNKPRYYSPWRDDPRPLEGIQHGLFVFGSIARFWLSVCKDPFAASRERAMAQRRVATLLFQLKRAVDEFSRHAKLTQPGQVFFSEMKEWVAVLEEETAGWDRSEMLPLFSGVLRDKSLKVLPVAEATAQHQARWEYLHLAGRYGQIG